MKRDVTTAFLAMFVAACGSSSISIDPGGSSGPIGVQPQPIPDTSPAAQIERTSFTASASSDGVTVAGLSASGAPPGESSGGVMVSALDLTTPGATVTAIADSAGAFSIDLPGGALGDRVLVYLAVDASLSTAFEVDTAAPATAASPCLLADGSSGLQLASLPLGEVASLALTFSSLCGAPLAIDGIAIAGDPVVTAPAAGFIVPTSGTSPSETFLVTTASAGRFVSFVILAAGEDRHVFTLIGSGATSK